MIKNIFIISLIVITTQTYTMKMDVEIEPFPLLLLPLDIQDLIASFLPFHDTESEQEFIERTKTEKKIPQKYRLNHLSDFELDSKVETVSASCPNNKIFAFLFKKKSLTNDSESSTLIFVDRHTNTKIYETHPDKYNISHIALSRNTTMFATIYQEEEYINHLAKITNCTPTLSIKNINSQKEQIFTIPGKFLISYLAEKDLTIAFNREETLIILHGYDYNQKYNDEQIDTNPLSKKNTEEKPMRYQLYQTFPVTVNTLDQNSDNTKTLAKYFKQQGVCKNFTKQITSKK